MNETIFFEPSSDPTSVVFYYAELLLAAAAGVVLPRWSHGLFVGAVVAIASMLLWTIPPAFVEHEPIPWWSLDYDFFVGATVFLNYVRWMAVFSIVYAARKLIDYLTLRFAA